VSARARTLAVLLVLCRRFAPRDLFRLCSVCALTVLSLVSVHTSHLLQHLPKRSARRLRSTCLKSNNNNNNKKRFTPTKQLRKSAELDS
jgi:hypothetical protein